MIDRRAFVIIIGGSILATSLAAEAQRTEKVWQIGVLTTVPLATLEASSLPTLLKAQGGSSADNSARCAGNLYGLVQWALCRVGYSEGQNIAIEARWGAPERLPAVAAELTDPDGARWPRPKPHDDQALVLLDFS